MTAAAFIVGVNATENVSVWDGSSITDGWYTSASTLYIDSAADLAAFVSSDKTFSGKTVVLRCDIVWSAGDASEWSEITAPSKTWTPIGTSSRSFRGTFDGNGHTVSGLYCYSETDGAGFFGYVTGATIRNLHIRNSYFNARTKVGSIVGSSTGGSFTISGCSSDAYVLSNYTVADNHHVGGIAGYLDGGTTYPVTVADCAFTGSITSDEGVNVGGIVGTIKGSTENVSRCLATGTYTARNRLGGIVGRSYLGITMTDCYADVDLITWGTSNQGGMIGGLRTTDTSSVPVLTVSGCYYNGNNLHVSNDAVGKFRSMPTRLGAGEYDATYTYGTVSASSTYYTDSDNDNSDTAQGNQAALTAGVTKLGGLTEFLAAKSATFRVNLYGDVVLKTLTYADHDCESHTGAWIADPSTGGQKAECLVPGCGTVVERDGSIQIMGASVRYDDPSGIRFLTKVDKNDFFRDIYNGDPANYTYTGANITFGTLIIPENLLAGELTAETSGALDVVAKKIYNTGAYSQTESTLYYTAVLVNFPESINTYNRELKVRSYMKYTDESDNVVYVYTDTKTTSFYDTASRVYESGAATAEIKSGLNMIRALGAVDDGFYDDAPNSVLLLEEASKELFDDYAASLESQGFTKHHKYDYVGNSFAMYYNEDFVVTFYYTPSSIGEYTEDNQDWYGNPTYIDDMNVIMAAVRVADIDNVMRVIVERRSTVDIPDTADDNTYVGLGIENTIAYAFPNDNYNYYGMGYIIQLEDGSFIIVDGGRNRDDPRNDDTRTDCDYIMEYLLSKYPSESQAKPVIAAWIFTHIHSDHVDAAKAFAAKYHDDVVLEQVIYNFMSGDTAVPVGARDQERWGNEFFKKYFPDAKICKAHTGYRFYVRNAEIRILCSLDDVLPDNEGTYFETMFSNNESCAFHVIIDGTQKIMFTGEVFIPGSRALVNMYGAELRSDIVQISHHGNFGATLELNRLIWPEDQDYSTMFRYALLPNGNNKQARQRLALAENAPFVNNLGENLSGKLNKIFVNGDLIFESGTISSGYTATQSNENVLASGAIGSWKTLPLYTYEDTDIIIPWPAEWN